jgi:MacB-like periplasmic core domain
MMLNRFAKYLLLGVPLLACDSEPTFDPPPEAYAESHVMIEGAASPQTIAAVDSTFFGSTLPLLGRRYIAQEFSANSRPVAILSHTFWSNHFNSRPDVIGSELEVDGILRRIVGIMPQGVDVPPGVALWIPRQ